MTNRRSFDLNKPRAVNDQATANRRPKAWTVADHGKLIRSLSVVPVARSSWLAQQ